MCDGLTITKCSLRIYIKIISTTNIVKLCIIDHFKTTILLQQQTLSDVHENCDAKIFKALRVCIDSIM